MSHRATAATTGDDAFEVRIAPKKYWFGFLFAPAWLAGWVVVGGRLLVETLSGGYTVEGVATLTLYVPWAMLWVLGIGVFGYGFAWNAFGYEAITISDDLLTIRKNVLGYGSVRSFRISEIEDIRAGGPGGDTIELDVGGETHKLRAHPGRPKAQEVVAQVKQHLP